LLSKVEVNEFLEELEELEELNEKDIFEE